MREKARDQKDYQRERESETKREKEIEKGKTTASNSIEKERERSKREKEGRGGGGMSQHRNESGKEEVGRAFSRGQMEKVSRRERSGASRDICLLGGTCR